ncbi:MAG: hypothetical protein U1E67_22040 [Hyphomicrobiales bacterium]
MSRAAATMSRLTADSADRRIRSTDRWSGFEILSIETPSESPILANSANTTTNSGTRLLSMANSQFIAAQ